MPYREHSSLDTDAKLKKILKISKQNKIILMQGRLKPYEEARLIEETMSQITKKFAGISFCTINPATQNGNKKTKPKPFATKLKDSLYNVTLGRRDILTIIGPASIVKDIRKNPNKIDLLINQANQNL
jgi:hypothetical protein|tara:strand:+ start:1458 stop:1841 length:384 start_codon:yes stop_codon:yes gene_type:complete